MKKNAEFAIRHKKLGTFEFVYLTSSFSIDKDEYQLVEVCNSKSLKWIRYNKLYKIKYEGPMEVLIYCEDLDEVYKTKTTGRIAVNEYKNNTFVEVEEKDWIASYNVYERVE